MVLSDDAVDSDLEAVKELLGDVVTEGGLVEVEIGFQPEADVLASPDDDMVSLMFDDVIIYLFNDGTWGWEVLDGE